MTDDIVTRLRDWAECEDDILIEAACADFHAAADEIERLRAALHEWDALIRHQYSGSQEAMSDMTYAAQHTAHLLYGDDPWPEPRRTALGEKTDG